MDADWTPASWTAPLDEASLEHTHGRGHGTMGVIGIPHVGRAVKRLRAGTTLVFWLTIISLSHLVA
jgi:hypothetical protein